MKVDVYCDGSYLLDEDRTNYGFIATEDYSSIHTAIIHHTSLMNSNWSVTAEIYGVILAVKWAISKGYTEVTVCHDYSGLAHWPLNQWKAKTEITKFYKDTIAALGKKIKINFRKVKGHSGNIFNDKIDSLLRDSMLYIQTKSSEELITYLEGVRNILNDNTFLISVTSHDEQPIVSIQYNRLPLVIDNELYGPKTLSFDDANALMNFILQKIKPEAEAKVKVDLIISCTDGISQSGAIAEFVVDTVGHDLINKEFFENKNLFLEPSYVTLNKLYLVKAIRMHIIEGKASLPQIAYNLLEGQDPDLAAAAKDYLLLTFKKEKILLKRII